jgi:two-component system response regulator AtoC
MNEPLAQALILVAEDDDLTRELLVEVLRRGGHRIVDVASGMDAIEQLKAQRFDLVLSDIQMAGAGGMEVLAHVMRTAPETAVVLITAFARPDSAMDAIAQGAVDYLTKPVDVFALQAAVARALERKRLTTENLRLRSVTLDKKSMVGTSAPMLNLYKQIAQVARTEAAVLLMGESGCGKELAARKIHDLSRRASGPYVPVNCATLAESILESELFGHERGAFTGAHSSRRGVFEEANCGTIFLDEIGDVPAKMQAQLLRVLQEGEVRRVGGTAPIKVDVRVVAATNRDLVAEVSSGRMREDLYYRLNVVAVRVPPLRDRGDDIVELARHFLVRYAVEFGRSVPDLSPEAITLLRTYPWPGNVRELENALARTIALSQRAVLLPEDFPSEVNQRITTPGRKTVDADWPTLKVLDERYILKVLEHVRDNKTHAANVLGIDRRTLQRLLAREEGEAE